MNTDRPLADIRERHRATSARAQEAFARTRNPRALLRALSRAADQTLRSLWLQAGMPGEAALVAVGGYGRGELFPQSDVDLLILFAEAPTEPQQQAVERLIGACWDVGLQIGHSVRTLDECLHESSADLTVQTSLLERRWLTGRKNLLERLSTALDAAMDAQRFFSAKMLEMRQRHLRFEDTPYSLEPNTKESPGGLRDLQVLIWMARAAGLGSTWRELAGQGLLTSTELRLLRSKEHALQRIRAALHIVARRREDRLVFDLQAQVAQWLGHSGADARRASEELMQHYYWAAKAVVQLSTLALQNLAGRFSLDAGGQPEPIDHEFCIRGGLLDIRSPELFERDPAAILRAFVHQTERPDLHGMTTETLRAIWHARTQIDGRFRAVPEHRSLFLRILQSPHGVTRVLRRMNQWSVLGRYLPPFRRIVGRMQHDLFHVYTVDQHILMVVRNLRRFSLPEHAHEYPYCSALIAGLSDAWLLVVAALFHDIAKGRGGDHSQLGRVDARRFCRAHGVSRDDTALVVFLVEHHLTMSTVAQKQDLSDPDVIERFARLVGTERRLTFLYLLTVADIRGTSPKVWNAWKAKLLEDLYRMTKRHLGGETPTASMTVAASRTEAIRLLNLQTVPPERYAAFWSRLDISYFIRTEASEQAWHARVLAQHDPLTSPLVRARLSPIGEGFQVVVYTADQPDLFARICGYFDSKNLSVLDAQIHTTPDGCALDSFLVIDPSGSTGYREMLNLVESELPVRLDSGAPLPTPVKGRLSRRSRYFPVAPSVDLRPDERGRRFLLSLTANDRTGLLYGIARVLGQHKVSLYAARIMTLGERVEDVLVVDGDALTHARSALQFESDLLSTLRA